MTTKYFSSFFPIRWFSLIDGGKLNNQLQTPGGSVEDGITATASGTKATAYQLSAAISRISVCATNADSVKLPTPSYVGQILQIINDGAATAQVFGKNSDTIDGVATATGVAMTTATRSFFTCTGVSGGVFAWRSQTGAKTT